MDAIQTNDTSDLLKKSARDVRIKDVGNKISVYFLYIITIDFSKFLVVIFNEILKGAKLTTNTDLGLSERCATENKVRIEKLQIFDSSFVIGKNFFGDDVLQSLFVYQLTISKLVFKKDEGSEYVTISLLRHEQVCLMRLRFERYFSHHRDTSLTIVHDV